MSPLLGAEWARQWTRGEPSPWQWGRQLITAVLFPAPPRWLPPRQPWLLWAPFCLAFVPRRVVFLFLFLYKFIYFYFIIYLFIYFWLHWVFVAARRLSLVVVSRGYSVLWCTGFSLWWLLLLQSTGSRHTGFSSCGALAQ